MGMADDYTTTQHITILRGKAGRQRNCRSTHTQEGRKEKERETSFPNDRCYCTRFIYGI